MIIITFEILEKIITDNQIPKSVELLSDIENGIWTEDMDCVQYSVERTKIPKILRVHVCRITLI